MLRFLGPPRPLVCYIAVLMISTSFANLSEARAPIQPPVEPWNAEPSLSVESELATSKDHKNSDGVRSPDHVRLTNAPAPELKVGGHDDARATDWIDASSTSIPFTDYSL